MISMGLLQSCFPRKPEALGACACFSAGGRKRGGAVRLSVARPAPGFLSAGLLSLRSSQRLILELWVGHADGAVSRCLCGCAWCWSWECRVRAAVSCAVALSGTVCCGSVPGGASSIALRPPLLPPGWRSGSQDPAAAGRGRRNKAHQQVHVSKTESKRGRRAARLPAVVGLARGLP